MERNKVLAVGASLFLLLLLLLYVASFVVAVAFGWILLYILRSSVRVEPPLLFLDACSVQNKVLDAGVHGDPSPLSPTFYCSSLG